MDLKKLQTPLFAFYNSLNVAGPPSPVGGIGNKENVSSICNLPPKSRSPNKVASRRFSTALDVEYSLSPRNFSRRASNIGDVNFRASQVVKEQPFDYQPEPLTPRYAISFGSLFVNFLLFSLTSYLEMSSSSSRFSEIQRKWKEELDEELERTRGKFPAYIKTANTPLLLCGSLSLGCVGTQSSFL